MSHYLVELYTPKPAWNALDAEARTEFFENIAAGRGPLTERGIDIVALGECDSAIPHAGHHTFFGIWRVPDKSALETLVTSINASGWHDYFETLNVSGYDVGLREHLKQLDRNAQAAR
jgi:hypothetical protein